MVDDALRLNQKLRATGQVCEVKHHLPEDAVVVRRVTFVTVMNQHGETAGIREGAGNGVIVVSGKVEVLLGSSENGPLSGDTQPANCFTLKETVRS